MRSVLTLVNTRLHYVLNRIAKLYLQNVWMVNILIPSLEHYMFGVGNHHKIGQLHKGWACTSSSIC